jgi:DNA invertase Pin-like site-specific DNA recombinase
MAGKAHAGRRWAVYARLSDASDEDQTGIDRQVADGIAEARHRGATQIETYVDDGVSAYKRKLRPAFEAMLADIEDGLVVAVVAWRAERLARQPRDAQRLIDALGAEDRDPRAVTYTIADGVDTSTDPGLFVFRQLVEFGRWESKAIGQRVARARKAAFEDGRYSGSPPAFGHRDGTRWREVVPAEAELLREAASRLLAGEGVRSILRDFNARGSRTRKGKPWQHTAFIKVLTSARMIGARMAGDSLVIGTEADGSSRIAPILDRQTWERLRARLLDPARRAHDRGGTPRHLLTGLLRCGACGGPLRAKGNAGKSHAKDYWTYGCVRDAYHPDACGKVWIRGSHTDAYVEQIVLASLRMPALVAAAAVANGSAPAGDESDESLRSELRALNERLVEAESAGVDGPAALEERLLVSVEGYRHWRTTALARRDELQRRLARSARARTMLRAASDPAGFWTEAPLADRREAVRALLPEIVVRQADPTARRRWDRRRIEWVAAS